MPTLRERTIEDLLSDLPGWQEFDESDRAELFVAAVGFEQRSASCFEKWARTAANSQTATLLLRYPDTSNDSAKQLERFNAASRSAGIAVHPISYDRLSVYGQVYGFMLRFGAGKAVLLDISSMASYAFYPTIAAICAAAPEARLRICYTEALD